MDQVRSVLPLHSLIFEAVGPLTHDTLVIGEGRLVTGTQQTRNDEAKHNTKVPPASPSSSDNESVNESVNESDNVFASGSGENDRIEQPPGFVANFAIVEDHGDFGANEAPFDTILLALPPRLLTSP